MCFCGQPIPQKVLRKHPDQKYCNRKCSSYGVARDRHVLGWYETFAKMGNQAVAITRPARVDVPCCHCGQPIPHARLRHNAQQKFCKKRCFYALRNQERQESNFYAKTLSPAGNAAQANKREDLGIKKGDANNAQS